MTLSFIIPFYRKLGLFRLTLPHNLPIFAQAATEVVLVVDEPESGDSVKAMAMANPSIKWQIIVNETAHEWRPPCKAINVGIRNAEGERFAVLSPETILLPSDPLYIRDCVLDNYVTGIIASVDAWRGIPSHDKFHMELMQSVGFGFLLAKGEALKAVGGYDEERIAHGLDDDCVRWKLQQRGPGVIDYNIRAVHLSHENNHRLAREQCQPVAMRKQDNWGQDFNKVIYDWKKL
jgi:hypothetical protein